MLVSNEETKSINEVTKLIQEYYSHRREQNPAYSMRSFARTLNVDQAYLLRILNGSRCASPQIAYKFAQHLRLSNEETLQLIVSTFK